MWCIKTWPSDCLPIKLYAIIYSPWRARVSAFYFIQMETISRILSISEYLLPGSERDNRLPRKSLACFLGFVCYFFTISGVIYDIVNEPASMGQSVDKKTGQIRPVAFLRGRINGQYILEGLAAAIIISLGSFGFIIIDRAYQTGIKRTNRILLLIVGFISVTISFFMINLFMSLKLPKYLQ